MIRSLRQKVIHFEINLNTYRLVLPKIKQALHRVRADGVDVRLAVRRVRRLRVLVDLWIRE